MFYVIKLINNAENHLAQTSIELNSVWCIIERSLERWKANLQLNIFSRLFFVLERAPMLMSILLDKILVISFQDVKITRNEMM